MEELRRFHFGDPAARTAALPVGVLPAALHSYRGKAIRSDWPLLAKLEMRGESWIRPLTLEERGQLSEGKLELAPGATLVPYGRRSPLRLAALAARRRLLVARESFAAEAQDLAAVAEALLATDRMRRPEGLREIARGGTMGGLGARFVDAAQMAEVVGRRRVGEPFSATQRQRVEAARDRLAAFDIAAEPLWIVPFGENPADLGAPAREADAAGDLCAAAATAFDELARETIELARAVRIVRLEAAEAFAPERHQAWLDRLDWRSLSRAELLLVPPVLVYIAGDDPFTSALPGLSALLLSGRPVQVVVLAGDEAQSEPPIHRLEPAYLGVAHREAFVQQGSLAFPLALAAGFSRALAGRRAGLHIIDAPGVCAPAERGSGDELDPWLVASARVSGRAAPLFRFDPEAGESWARRLHFDENPAPASDWPTEPLPEAGDASAVDGAPRSAAFTFADAALLDPVWRPHFACAGAEASELRPLAEWLEVDDEENVRSLPFVWGADMDGGLHRLVVSRALALASRDRLSYWRTLQELAGVRNEHVLAAVERARAEAEERASAERDELAARQAAELESVRATADQRAVDSLVAMIFELGPEMATAPEARPQAAVVASARPATPVPPELATVERPARLPAAPAAPVTAGATEEAWIDTALCTSCDECIRKSPGIFAYNANKQAFVKSPRGGSYRDLVVAAETCTAKIIHPGTPWNPAEPNLEGLRARALAFA